MHSTYIIAEAGPNHNGSVDVAVKMIRELANIGVDAVKFQLAKPDKLYSIDSFKADYQKEIDGCETAKQMSAKNQLSHDEHKLVYGECKKCGLDYSCTAFDLESLIFLDINLELPFFKIASGEIFSLDIIEYISRRNKKVVLSTGMATFFEIETAINLINKYFRKDIIILHCVSSYPAVYREINLNVINELKKRFGYPVGFSDHTTGNECAIGAVALGACLIEKHVTLDKNMHGPDHRMSLTIEEMERLVKSIRHIDDALGYAYKDISEKEMEIAKASRKSIVAARDLEVGVEISEYDICFKRPGTGFLPIERETIIGKKVKVKIEKDRVIRGEMIEWQ